MPCDLDRKCECASVPNFPRHLCNHFYLVECPNGPVEEENIQNWCRLPPGVREKCRAHLKTQVLLSEHGEDIIKRWTDQSKRHMRIGSDDAHFHFGAGMAVRNVLRQVVKDHMLPSGNWDDYYVGALEALVFEGAST